MTSGHDLGFSSARRQPQGLSESAPTDSPVGKLAAAVAVLGLAALAVISVIPLGATRVFSWPWWIVYAVALASPACTLILRALDRSVPLVLPSRAWCVTALATAAVIVGSALASPYRGPSLLWSAPLLAAVAVFFVVFDALNGATSVAHVRRPLGARASRPPFDEASANPELAGGRPAPPGDDSAALPSSGLSAITDGDRHDRRSLGRRTTAWGIVAALGALIAVASLVEWLAPLGHSTLRELIAARNPFPLGHANYTAGLGLLFIPAFAALALRHRGLLRLAGAVGALLALALLFSSGSRGGMIALAAMIAVAILLSPLRRATKARIAVIGVLAAGVLVAANPRTRAMFEPADPNSPPNISNVQRTAMLRGGLHMGHDRPLLGWGPGTTPLVFPRYRAGLDGGAEDVLQLHDVPVQLWAELGAAGLVCAVAALLLGFRDAARDRTAAVALAGYAVFSLFDAQLDVPVFGFGVAALAALLAAPAAEPPRDRQPAVFLGVFATLVFALVVLLGHRDPTPRLNALALSDAVGRKQPQRAVALLQESLALNPDQEIAHFNLGWLQVVDDPKAAAAHFTTAAHLVPDKGGVYFGLGLARLNAGDRAGAAAAFALEALNDPIFVLSPWWQNPALAPLRPAMLQALADDETRAAGWIPTGTWAARELAYLRAFNAWLTGKATAASVAAVADTPERRSFFARGPVPADVTRVGDHTLRRERVGYPVLMRNLDIAPPLDLWVVQESATRDSALGYLWPDKGWSPSPVLIALLDGTDPRKN